VLLCLRECCLDSLRAKADVFDSKSETVCTVRREISLVLAVTSGKKRTVQWHPMENA
jgi:hypothetical protein